MNPNLKIKETSLSLLIVEGMDEEKFFKAMLEQMQLSVIQVMPVGGKTQLVNNLTVIVKDPNFKQIHAIGIVRDGDDDHIAAFQSVCDALRKVVLPVPRAKGEFTIDKPGTAVLLIPPTEVGTNRMLEDLCLASAEDDPAMVCVEQYFECLASSGIALRDNVIAKAKVHAYLASRSEPDKRLGEAAAASYWNWSHVVFEPVKEFLRQLSQP
jgi:hypothetical protein